ncbi:glycosyltransferase 87 family protein [Bdellovibrio sp. HCB117]|uniref:glycosyltransferase 87 family protein n=1 Tax=Bdellovibrio sp. HCB117 TaxID=3394359 RepID=UPI0039B69BEB
MMVNSRFFSLFKYLIFGVIALAVLQTPLKVYFSNKGGWDHHIYCEAIKVSDKGLDPYITANLGSELSFTYPAIFLEAYRPFCVGGPKAYLIFHFAILLFISFVLIRKLKWDPYLTITWLFLGYNAAFSNYNTGNIGIFEALFFVLFLWCFKARNYQGGILWLSPSAFVKVVPSLMAIPAILLAGDTVKQKVKAFFVFVTGVLSLVVINFFYSQELFYSFFRQILGKYSNQHSPINEIESNASNITILLFFKNLSEKLLNDFWIAGALFFLILLAYLSYFVWKSVIKTERDKIVQLCWSYLLLMLWLPRLKPYSLLIVCIVMIPILKKLGRRTATLLLLTTIFHRSLNGDKSDPWIDFFMNNSAVYAYIGILIYLVIRLRNRTDHVNGKE